MRNIPLVTFFDFDESEEFKFVQIYVNKGGLVLPYMRFDGRFDLYHSNILETMLMHHHIIDFNLIEDKKVPELGGIGQKYHAVGMGHAMKDNGELNIIDSESFYYCIGRNKEHFNLISPYSKIKLNWK